MTDNDTLLSHIARWRTIGREDIATDALAFILSRSTAARRAFADFLGDGNYDAAAAAPEIAAVRTQYTLSNGPAPDMACLDDSGQVLALVESKFWAGLTANQPVAYWNALPADASATLLFLAPAHRIDPGGLWGELTHRLEQAGHPLASPVHKAEHTITAQASDGSRRLMLTSWKTLLDYLGQAAWQQQDAQAAFEIAQLQGLANSVITGSDPSSNDGLKRLVTRAVRQLVQAEWASTKGYGVSVGHGFWRRGLRLAGADGRFGIYFDEARRSGRPLWLGLRNSAKITSAQMDCHLESLDEPIKWETTSSHFCAHIAVPLNADNDAALNSIVVQLTQIAQLIDPAGPTYRKDAPNA